jgi:hypothetical protein
MTRLVAYLLIAAGLQAMPAPPDSENVAKRFPFMRAAGLRWQETPRAAKTEDIAALIAPLPFASGETLTYDVTVSRFLIGGTVGQLRLQVNSVPNASVGDADRRGVQTQPTADNKAGNTDKSEGRDVPPVANAVSIGRPQPEDLKGPLLEFKAEAVSKGFLLWLLGIKVNDRFRSVVDPKDLGLLLSIKNREEGKLKRDQTCVINRKAGRLTYTDVNLEARTPPTSNEVPSPSWIQDVLSGVYYLRTCVLNKGQTVKIPITDGGKIYTIDAVVGDREPVEVGAGKFNAIQVNIKAFDGHPINRSGELFLWISDDSRRLPVRARAKTAGVGVSVNLTSIHQVK